jgi:hypothetical protein
LGASAPSFEKESIMTMQYDVRTSKIQGVGFLYAGRVRLKQATVLGNGTVGYVDFFDTTTAPVAATYGRSGNTVTVTSAGHGLQTGAKVGIAYVGASNIAPVSGNYPITVVDANTFTITDLNSGTISTGTVCNYVANGDWVLGINTGTNLQPYQVLVPGEGALCVNGIYVNSLNITSTQVTYG